MLTEEEARERANHRDALLDIRAILKAPYGRRFIKYLFRSGNPTELPPHGTTGKLLHEMLGTLRANVEIFNIVSEADPETAAAILAEITKEKNERLAAQQIADE